MSNIYLYGFGGHSRVILDILQQRQQTVAGFVSDNPPSGCPHFENIPIFSAESLLSQLSPDECQWIIAIGNNSIRQKIAQKLRALGHSFVAAVHPSAQIGSRVIVSPGTVIMANAVVSCDTALGVHVIVNTGATIDHDCTIADFCHVAPGATVCGHVTVGAGSWLQVGTNVAPCTEIAPDTVSRPGDCII
ncbi:MAG: acetyltransferase [Cyanobacteria bacterium P01_F01_bin.150]